MSLCAGYVLLFPLFFGRFFLGFFRVPICPPLRILPLFTRDLKKIWGWLLLSPFFFSPPLFFFFTFFPFSPATQKSIGSKKHVLERAFLFFSSFPQFSCSPSRAKAKGKRKMEVVWTSSFSFSFPRSSFFFFPTVRVIGKRWGGEYEYPFPFLPLFFLCLQSRSMCRGSDGGEKRGQDNKLMGSFYPLLSVFVLFFFFFFCVFFSSCALRKLIS